MVSGLIIYCGRNQSIVRFAEEINGRHNIISDIMRWHYINFSICAGVRQVFFDLADIKRDIHEAYSAALVKRLDDYIMAGT